MNAREESDRPVVPANHLNNAEPSGRAAEGGEGRGRTKENPQEDGRDRTQRRADLTLALARIREGASKDKKQQFTALLHHVYNVEALRLAYEEINSTAAPGPDGVTWEAYGQNLEDNLRDLSERLKRGAYRASPVRRAYIPKPDGGQRPLGVTGLEDKMVQRAMAAVLGAIYEVDFIGFSYGFRPKRNPHGAMDALHAGLMTKKVNWVLDADIRGFFDSIDHEWLMKFVGHRIADRRVIRLIRKWLKAGIMENETWRPNEEGTPQGGSISPLLANLYLHYVFDLWANAWRTRADGDVIVVRYADDYIVGFQHRTVAERFLRELQTRLERFGLELHPEKTRLIEFGRFAIRDRSNRGERKPETFDFLGFTHICSIGQGGGFVIRRQTIRKRLQRKLRALKEELRRRMHDPVPDVGCWLYAAVDGYFGYHAVPTNGGVLNYFRFRLGRLWHHELSRRSQRARLTWERMQRLIATWLPPVQIRHPWPCDRFFRHHPR